MSKFLRQSLMIFIIKGFRTIVFIFIVISTTFWLICPLAFFRCLLNSGTFKEFRTTSFIESTGVVCSDSISHRVHQRWRQDMIVNKQRKQDLANWRWKKAKTRKIAVPYLEIKLLSIEVNTLRRHQRHENWE